jgi:hypothetical protein
MPPEPDRTTLAREPYEPPVVDRIRIVQNEMAVAGCKTTTVGIASGRACRISTCRNVGS